MDTEVLNPEILAPDAAPATPRPLVAAAPSAPATATPATVLAYAIDRGADITHVEKLLELQMRWEANEARKAYVADMAEFKKNPPTIIKDKHVSFGEGRSKTEYNHATIGNVTNNIVAALAQHGFSHSWKPEQRDGLLIITCVITHRLGHSESVTLQSNPDSSGGKNGIQSIGSAQTYLQRYTLLAATGLATHDQDDDDAAGAGDEAGRNDSLGVLWAAKAKATPTRRDLDAVWLSGKTKIETAGTQQDMDTLQAACVARAAEMNAQPGQPAQTNRSTRLSRIIGAGAPGQEGER